MNDEIIPPDEAARITYDLICRKASPLVEVMMEACGMPQPIQTPITFWEGGYLQWDEQNATGGCTTSGATSIRLIVYNECAGTIQTAGIGSSSRLFSAEDADAAAYYVFTGERDYFLKKGYIQLSERRTADRLTWIGRCATANMFGEFITAKVEFVRGPVRPNDPAVLALAELLKADPPYLDLYKSSGAA